MATVWHGIVNPPRTKNIVEWDYSKDNISSKRRRNGALHAGINGGITFPS
jgi:phosphatidylserine decarboxylase